MDITKMDRCLDSETHFAIVFLDVKFNPDEFMGEKFIKCKVEKYISKDDEEVLAHPKYKNITYSKEIIEKAKKIVEILGYKFPQIWFPSKAQDSPAILSYDGAPNNHMIAIAPQIHQDEDEN